MSQDSLERKRPRSPGCPKVAFPVPPLTVQPIQAVPNPYWRLRSPSSPGVIPPPPGSGRQVLPFGLQMCSKASPASPATRVVRGRCGRFGSQSYLRSVGEMDEPFGRLEPKSTEEKEALEVAELLESLPPHHLKEDLPETEPCAVCREQMHSGDLVRRLPCAHVFHASCIARWLCVKATCPLDNSKVLEALQPKTEAQVAAPRSPAIASSSSSPLYQPSRSPSPTPATQPTVEPLMLVE